MVRKLSFFFFTFLCFYFSQSRSNETLDLWIIGDQSEPVTFVMLPFFYSGDNMSPAVFIEDSIKNSLSSTGLFAVSKAKTPRNSYDPYYWLLKNVRFVIRGKLFEKQNNLTIDISIEDMYGLEPIEAKVVVPVDQLHYGINYIADRVHRSLFYATYTPFKHLRYLNDENTLLTSYLHQLVHEIKFKWDSQLKSGYCSVDVDQLPGGRVFDYELHHACYQQKNLAEEVSDLISDIERLPYEGYESVYQRKLKLYFVHADTKGRKQIMHLLFNPPK